MENKERNECAKGVVIDRASAFEQVKEGFAEKLRKAAGTVSEKSADPHADPRLAACGQEVSAWLDRSADYVRKFDYQKAEHAASEYVGRNPARSLIIAGLVGFVLGAIVRRR